MKKRNYTGVPKYYIETRMPKTNRLIDISEEGFDTIELCQAQIDAENKEDEEILQELDAKHEQELKCFILDLDITDRPPVNPRKFYIKYVKVPHLYIYDENGHHEITEHCINDLHLLNASGGEIHKINSILNGTLDPETFQSVQSWVSQCVNKPSTEEMQLHAINQILEGYGIESLRTTKRKNGYWCDILCTYVNMGDSYTATMIRHRKHGFMVASVGDIIEKNKHAI